MNPFLDANGKPNIGEERLAAAFDLGQAKGRENTRMLVIQVSAGIIALVIAFAMMVG